MNSIEKRIETIIKNNNLSGTIASNTLKIIEELATQNEHLRKHLMIAITENEALTTQAKKTNEISHRMLNVLEWTLGALESGNTEGIDLRNIYGDHLKETVKDAQIIFKPKNKKTPNCCYDLNKVVEWFEGFKNKGITKDEVLDILEFDSDQYPDMEVLYQARELVWPS